MSEDFYAQQQDAPAPKRSYKALWAGLVIFGVVAAVCGVVALNSPDDPRKKPAAASTTASASPSPSPSSASPTASASPEPKTHVVGVAAPSTLAGRARLTDAQHTKGAADTVAAIKKDSVGLFEATVGYYGTTDPAKDKFYVVTATMTFPVDDGTFERSMAGVLTDGISSFTNVATPDQGPGGGTARCGDVRITNSLTGSMCGYYVGASMVFVLWYNHKVAKLVAELPKLRQDIDELA